MVICRVYYEDFGWISSDMIMSACDFILYIPHAWEWSAPPVKSDYDEPNKSDTPESEKSKTSPDIHQWQ